MASLSSFPAPLTDGHGRRIDYLRLSVTDRCDLRRRYCMAEDMSFLPRSAVLSIEEMGRHIFEHILRAASGEPTKSELLGLGDHEFVPWHLGIVS